MIKTFRGLLEDGGQDHIRLQTIKGKVGYRVVKFQIISETPTTASTESVVQIWKTQQGTPVATINFTDTDLLGIGLWTSNEGSQGDPEDLTIIFDNEIFNQDIFITHQNSTGSEKCNYYLELEVIPLTDSDAEFTTLKDIRGRNTT